MKRLSLWFLLVSMFGAAVPLSTSQPAPTLLAIIHVTIIDATGAEAAADQTVVIKGDRISSQGRTGVVAIPKEGKLLGPFIVAAGLMVDGPSPMFPELSIAVASEMQARQAVNDLKSCGSDFIKVYSLLSRESYFAVADEAIRRDIPFAGHVPESVSASEASDAGQRSIEHLSGVRLACSTSETELRKELIEARAKSFQDRIKPCRTVLLASVWSLHYRRAHHRSTS